MSAIDDGGPAYPSEQGHTPDGTWNQTYCYGMSLRDWFAGQSLAGYFAHSTTPHMVSAAKMVAEYMYEMADEMIAARSKGNSE